jgi:hypothetical protein
MIVLITPTRDRPEAFALCERYMESQTERKFFWLVVDDGDAPAVHAPARGFERRAVLRREPSKLVNTLPHNLMAALQHPMLSKPEGQLVLMIEDDEWYHPKYVETMVAQLEQAKQGFVGQANARYYHLLHRAWWCPDNQQHASLCRTAWVHNETEASWVRSCTADALKEGDPFIDMRIWKRRPLSGPPSFRANPKLKLLQEHQWMSVGMKGLPGRPGLGSAHTGGSRWAPDPKGAVLAGWSSPGDRDVYFRLLPASGDPRGAAPGAPRSTLARGRGKRTQGPV